MNEEVFMFDGVQSADPISIEDTKPLLACRGCLAASRPLRPLERAMAALYEDLVGPNVSPSDILPKFVCGYCHAMLLKFAKFRDRCRSSQATFLNILSAGIPINLDLLESSGSGASYPELVKTSVQQIVLDGNVDDKFRVHNLPGNIWVSIEKEQLGLSGNPDNVNNDFRAFEYKCEPTLYSYSMQETDVGLTTGNTDDVNVKDDIDNDSHDFNDEPDVPDCLAGFNSDIYKKDTKNPFKDDLNTASKKTKNKIKPKVKSIGGNVAAVSLVGGDDVELLPAAATMREGADCDYSDDDCLATTSTNLTKGKQNAVTNTIAKKKCAKRRKTKKTSTIKETDYSWNGIIKWLKNVKAEKLIEKKKEASMMKKSGNVSVDFFSASAIESHKRLFEKRYNMKAVVLSKEEQIERLQARKDAPNYKDANFKCEMCFNMFLTDITFANHMAKHDASQGDFICNICSLRYSSRRKLKEHFKKFHLFEYTCKQCGKVCKHGSEAVIHNSSHKGVTHSCKICEKSFTLKTSLIGHMHLSHGGTVQCSICYGKFMGNAGLNCHMRYSHKEAVDAVCGDCGVQFHSVAALQRHLAADDHSHACAVCGEAFDNDQLLQEHQQEKHEMNFDCGVCGKQCVTSFKLKAHMQRHNPHYKDKLKQYQTKKAAEDGPFICEMCGATKTSKTSLRAHIYSHTKPFQCNYCDRRFGVKILLQHHISCKHMDMQATPALTNWPCQYCDKMFNCKSNRWRHENMVHLKKRPFTCTCGATYQDKHALQMHINTKHLGLPWPKRDRRPRRQVRSTQDYAEDCCTKID